MLYFIGVAFCAVHALQLYADDCPTTAGFYGVMSLTLSIFGILSLIS